MSVLLNGFATVPGTARVGLVALALAAVAAPGANAASHHAAAVSSRAPVRSAVRGSAAGAHHAAQQSSISVRAGNRHAAAATKAAPMQVARGQARMPQERAHGKQYAVPQEKFIPLSVIAARDRSSHSGARGTAVEPVADRSTQDRVHAWYTAHRTGNDTKETAKAAPVEALPAKATKQVPLTAVMPSVEARLGTAQPERLPIVGRVTVADLDRAVQKPLEAPQPIPSSHTRTTADDDAAFAAASNIPSTAPTEREPAPFIHGDLLGRAAQNVDPSRQGAVAHPVTPAVTRVDLRGDAEVLAAAPGSVPSPGHPASPSAAALTPKPAPIVRSPAPAADTVAAADRKLDHGPADAISQGALSADTDPAGAGRKIVTLTTATAKSNALTKSAVAPAPGGGYDVDLTGGPLVKVNLYDQAGKLILLPAMKGSREILIHQNQMAITDGLDRVEDDNQLLDMRRMKLLVALPDDDSIQPDGRLPLNRRFARPWAIRFLNDLSRAHYARFHTPLIVTSAVRTVAFQRRLVLTNGNAAPPTGEVASPHLYGQALDIAKHGMSMTEIAWMRSYLTPIESAGKIDVEEEFQQACFHLSVYRRYLGLPQPKDEPAPQVAPQRILQQAKTTPAKRRHLPTALLATGLR